MTNETTSANDQAFPREALSDKQENDRLEDILGDLYGLSEALQIVIYEFAQMVPGTPIQKHQRDALVGMGNAIEQKIKEW